MGNKIPPESVIAHDVAILYGKYLSFTSLIC